MGRILKVRQRKMAISESPAESPETTAVRSIGTGFIVQATHHARARLAESSKATWDWSATVLASTNGGHFSTPNSSYESSLATASLHQARIVHNMTVCVGGVLPGTEACEANQQLYAAHILKSL